MQKANFSIEIVIGDDNSSDGTPDVLMNYAREHPNIIKLNLRNIRGSGIPGKQNFITTLEMCTGEYIALCDGDDYWTDPYKLQKQVDFLEANPDFSICFHKATICYEKGVTPFYPDINKETKAITTLEDIVKGNYIHTPTVVFRNNLKGKLPTWFKDAYPGDWPLHILNATYGKIKFIPEEMATYRVHRGGIHSMSDGQKISIKGIPTLRFLGIELSAQGYNKLGNQFLKSYHYSVAYAYGLNACGNLEQSKIKRSYNLLFYGNWKMKLCCWFPLIFRDKSFEMYSHLNKAALKQLFNNISLKFIRD